MQKSTGAKKVPKRLPSENTRDKIGGKRESGKATAGLGLDSGSMGRGGTLSGFPPRQSLLVCCISASVGPPGRPQVLQLPANQPMGDETRIVVIVVNVVVAGVDCSCYD
ncbi:hypothetical protein BOTCAL_0903g00020 [Botryotinia calthae]|uniref:Uncharacterized protein n=1 Tax=Botryotinia calthae TaxID=38488 RepID=A0A4Y8CH50_9HELO|nr:hypothetical protein BOTCAL_0903g00020 [Botryotinia calthae]